MFLWDISLSKEQLIKLKEQYWFPFMKRYVRRHISMCFECLVNKVPGVVKKTSVQKVLKALKAFVYDYGLAEKIISDKGLCLTSHQFENYGTENGIRHVLNSSKHPRANSNVERANRTVLTTIVSSTQDNGHRYWDSKIKEVERNLNNFINKTTNKTPFEMLHGYSSMLHGYGS
ncbi:transposon Tf2-8 polyprotein [Trichonephila clavipes]|nr:transposon Tf2-8 polyprotein [Trichonephila clavipes]